MEEPIHSSLEFWWREGEGPVDSLADHFDFGKVPSLDGLVQKILQNSFDPDYLQDDQNLFVLVLLEVLSILDLILYLGNHLVVLIFGILETGFDLFLDSLETGFDLILDSLETGFDLILDNLEIDLVQKSWNGLHDWIASKNYPLTSDLERLYYQILGNHYLRMGSASVHFRSFRMLLKKILVLEVDS